MKAAEALREADRAFQQTPLPPAALSRLRRRVFDRPSRAPWLVVAAAAAATVAAFVFWPRAQAPEPAVEDVRLSAAQRYEHGRFVIRANAPSLLHRDRDALTVKAGEVEVSVAKSAERVRIGVSHGVIEVVGTRFTIRQREDGGDVTLHEGVIHFVGEDVRVLAPGETYAWPPRAKLEQPPEPAAPEEPPAPPKVVKKPPPREPSVIRETDASWLLDEVETCRSRGDYAEAVRLLDKGLAGIVSPATRERFSFELGSILTWQLADARACRQWQSHLAAFPNGRYAREVQRAMEKAQCAPR